MQHNTSTNIINFVLVVVVAVVVGGCTVENCTPKIEFTYIVLLKISHSFITLTQNIELGGVVVAAACWRTIQACDAHRKQKRPAIDQTIT